MSSVTPVRFPDLRSQPVMTRRAWWLVGLNILIPGSAQVLAGNRRFGRFALGATLVFWALIIISVAAALIGRSHLIAVVTLPVVLWLISVVLVFYGLIWLVCTFDAVRLARLIRVRPAARVAVAVLALAALVLTGGGAFSGAWLAGVTAQIVAKVGSDTVNITAPGGKGVPVGPITGPVNLLIVGSDSGDGNAAYGPRSESLNDVTILVHISPDSRSVTAMSIPRDLYVPQPACSADGKTSPAVAKTKFNTALERGGLACVAASVTALTGLPVQYASLIQFDGVVAMSDAVGGVPVCLASGINDPKSGLVLAAGEHSLQGAQALAFLRTRHGLTTGSDLQRISNQQIFLSSLMRKIKDSSTLSNPVELAQLASAAANHMQLSNELAQTTTMVSLALALKSIPLNRIVFVQYPSTASYVNRISVTLPDTADAAVLTQAIASDRAVATSTLGSAAIAEGGTGAAPAPSASPTSGASAVAAPIVLPAAVSGQSAGQQTCSVGQTG